MIFKLTGRAKCFIQAKQCAKPYQCASTHIALQPPNYNPNYSYRQQQYDRRGTCSANHCALHLQKRNSDPFSQRRYLRALAINLLPAHCHLCWFVLHHPGLSCTTRHQSGLDWNKKHNGFWLMVDICQEICYESNVLFSYWVILFLHTQIFLINLLLILK